MACFVLRDHEAEATPPQGYMFAAAGGRCVWPTRHGERLGACGTWNFLWRLGWVPRFCSPETVVVCAAGDTVFVQVDRALKADAIDALRNAMARGTAIVMSGSIRGWMDLHGTPSDWKVTAADDPYAALAFVCEGETPELVAPPGWTFATRTSGAIDAEYGRVATVGAERQTPIRASVVPVDGAPAIVRRGRCWFVNANPFAAFQSWLQGQEDLQPWLAWRHRLFWLDEWVDGMAALLIRAEALGGPGPGIAGLASSTVVLRHDVDDSRDPAYLEDERSRNVPATYAVLPDRNREFWVRSVSASPGHEVAFHYSTGHTSIYERVRGRLNRQRAARVRPARRRVVAGGLLTQVRDARQKGIGVATLHRHLGYLFYPEWIDALDNVLASERNVLGGSSLFRAQVLRWGTDRVDGISGTIGEWPDPQFPLWLPFRTAHAGRGGRLLRGWETTSVMESEPELVMQMLDHRTRHLRQRVLTLNYHPAHASRPTFRAGGSRRMFREVLDLVIASGSDVRTLADVYAHAEAASH